MKNDVNDLGTSYVWIFYLIYSVLSWCLTVVGVLLLGYDWHDCLMVIASWLSTSLAYYIGWSVFTIKALRTENEELRKALEREEQLGAK